MTTPDTIAPVIEQLHPMSGSFACVIPLEDRVSDNSGVVSVTFQASKDYIIWNELGTIAVPQSPGTVHVKYDYEVSKVNEGIVVVRAIARDAAGNTSKASKYVEYKVDRTAPQIPQGLQVSHSGGYITLQWDQGDD
ncbi:hypothetical protein, partial [Stenotrophomonas maltophilia group sp. RNC7]|uniref:hypothetical protein n=1 Tax=Stenotrophomonas maltophilia group sp. RNC7 TaxID=3071467 RepID=UPI0027E14827